MAAPLSLHDKIVLNCVFNPSLPLSEAYEEELSEEIKDIEEDSSELETVKHYELEAIVNAERKNYEEALKLINEAITLMPDKASLYNNRAQIHQLLEKWDNAFNDLAKAIELAEDKQKRTLCQAFCQRGLLHRKNNHADLAREDFTKAAELGSKFAKSQLVELNPYAALCNQMLRKVMDELK